MIVLRISILDSYTTGVLQNLLTTSRILSFYVMIKIAQTIGKILFEALKSNLSPSLAPYTSKVAQEGL